MKALVYTNPLEVQIQDRPEPDLAPGEVVLRIDAVGICGSDMHAYHGHDPRRKPGLVLGHEFCGTIVKTDAPGFLIGQRVTGNPLITCGVCDYCVQGRNNLCSRRTMVGMTRPGAFAEFMSIPAASLIEMPQDMPAIQAALTEPAATALHAINMSLKAMARPLPENRTLIDHQTAVMSPIGRPPVLAVGHECGQVFLERGHIQLFDFFAVIEVCPHGVGFGVVLVQDVQVKCLWPPSHSGVGRAGVGIGTVHNGALARAGGGGVHGVSFVVGISRFGVCKHGLVATAAERKNLSHPRSQFTHAMATESAYFSIIAIATTHLSSPSHRTWLFCKIIFLCTDFDDSETPSKNEVKCPSS